MTEIFLQNTFAYEIKFNCYMLNLKICKYMCIFSLDILPLGELFKISFYTIVGVYPDIKTDFSQPCNLLYRIKIASLVILWCCEWSHFRWNKIELVTTVNRMSDLQASELIALKMSSWENEQHWYETCKYPCHILVSLSRYPLHGWSHVAVIHLISSFQSYRNGNRKWTLSRNKYKLSLQHYAEWLTKPKVKPASH